MTQQLARLAEIAKEQRRLAEEAEHILSGFNDASRVTQNEKPDRVLTTAQAAKIARRSYSSLYRDALSRGIGWKLPTGVWQFSESALHDFLSLEKHGRGEVGEGGGEVGDGAPLPLSNDRAHADRETE
ncbi:MAG: hypothetical protein CTY36_10650 [Methylocystis sp.]|nr:MAG: hypothetical protein CTY36_10650 [Methylocystis sp.]PPD23866.1 MAG: hypothetical protein CTY30_02195 [Methylocystis sp.]